MKQFDLVKLINKKPYNQSNITESAHGIILNHIKDNLLVLFFNSQNIGDYIVINVKARDIVLEKEKLPKKVVAELSDNLEKIINKAKVCFKPIKVKMYAQVELLVEEDRYSKFGVHKGDVGYVVDNNAVNDYIEVDFSYHNESSIGVKIDDLKVIN